MSVLDGWMDVKTLTSSDVIAGRTKGQESEIAPLFVRSGSGPSRADGQNHVSTHNFNFRGHLSLPHKCQNAFSQEAVDSNTATKGNVVYLS